MELIPSEYHRVKPLFRLLDDHLAVQAILERLVPAPVFADRTTRPRMALTWTGHRIYLAGSAHNMESTAALRRLFRGTIYPQATEARRKALVVYYSPDVWEPELEGILRFRRGPEDVELIGTQRHLYTITRPRPDWREGLPEGYALRSVERDLLKDRQLKNLDLLTEEMCSERPSVADFLARSFGVCAIHGGEVAGWCLSEYNTSSHCEVGIETLPAHRRRGLGRAMASALIEQALSRGLSRINWHCYAGNEPSVATALSAGFEMVRNYPVIIVKLDMS